MKTINAEKIAGNADMIVCGYAYSIMEDGNIRVLKLAAPSHALVMTPEGEALETTMDDVELEIVAGYWKRNKKYVEESYAEVL